MQIKIIIKRKQYMKSNKKERKTMEMKNKNEVE